MIHGDKYDFLSIRFCFTSVMLKPNNINFVKTANEHFSFQSDLNSDIIKLKRNV